MDGFAMPPTTDMGSETLRFQSFELQPEARRLLVDGEPAKLGARAFDVLMTLIEHRDRVVSKQELIDRVWPGLVVEENNLQVHVSALRKILGSGAVATIPGRGYRFTAPLGGERRATADGGKAVTESEPLSIAVLPFVNMSVDPEQNYFADGITEDIITELSRWRSLKVPSRNATVRFKEKSIDVQQVGRDLGVHFVVEGSVRRMGERVRVTAQLVDATTGHQLWGERFDRPMSDLFVVQDEVIHTIVGTLVGRVHATGFDRARRKPPSSLDAYDQTLRGNALLWDDPASANEAKRAFQRAIELDPGYGLPHSLLAVLLCREWENDCLAPRELLDRAHALAQRGIELADDESTCHTVLGQICLDQRSYDLALRHAERGFEINPVNQWTRADVGLVLSYIGRAEEGLDMFLAARRADPYFGPTCYWRGLGLAQFMLRRYADAVPDFERGLTDHSLWALALMAGCYAKLGQAAHAQAMIERCQSIQREVGIAQLLTRMPFKREVDRRHLAECLRLAGMPE